MSKATSGTRAAVLLAGVAAILPAAQVADPVFARAPLTAAAPAGSQGAGSGGVRLEAPGKGWILTLDLPGFELGPPRTAADGRRRVVFGEDETTGLEVSVVLEEVPGMEDAAGCRDHFGRVARRRSRAQRSAVHRRRDGEAEIVDYLLEGFQDGALRQRHVNAYLFRDRVCADVHLSKERFAWNEAGAFESILRSIRIEPPPGSPETNRESGGGPDVGGAAVARAASRRAFPVPGRTWSAVLETFGLVMDGSSPVFEIEPEGRRFREQRVTGRWWTGRRVAAGLALAVFAGEATSSGNADACRDALWPRIRLGLPARLEGVRRGEAGRAAWVDYRKPWRQRARIDVRVRHVFLAHGGVCVSATLERIDPGPGDGDLFEAFLEAAEVREAAEAREAPEAVTPP